MTPAFIRTAQGGIERALGGLDDLRKDLVGTGVDGTDLRFNLTWHDWLNLDSLITVSQAIVSAALKRKNSRGAHYREDFSNAGDMAASRYTVVYNDGTGLVVDDEAVDFSIVSPGQTIMK